MLTCQLCGLKSTSQFGFIEHPTYQGKAQRCLACVQHRAYFTDHYRTIAWTAAIFLVLALMVNQTLLGAISLAAAAYTMAWLSIGLHEAGHLLAAWSSGVGVSAFSIGGGARSAVRRVTFARRPIFLLFGPFASEGLTVLSVHNTFALRWRLLWISLGGPLANLLAAAYLYWAVLPDLSTASFLGQLVLVTALVNAYEGISNLLPSVHETPAGQQASDGASILALLFGGLEDAHELIDSCQQSLAQLEAEHGDRRRALQLVEGLPPALAQEMIATHAELLADAGRNDEAIELLESAIAATSDDLPGQIRAAQLRNNLGYVLLASLKPEYVRPGAALVAQAYSLLPMSLAVRHSQGLAETVNGHPQAALPLLEDERFQTVSDYDRGAVNATLALTYDALNHERQALQHLQKAQQLAPENRLVKSAARTLHALQSL